MTAEGGTEHMLDKALMRLGLIISQAGCTSEEVAAEVRAIAASWWLDVQAGGTPPERLHLLVAELRQWCLVAGNREAQERDRLERAGCSMEAGRASTLAAGFRRAADELRLFE